MSLVPFEDPSEYEDEGNEMAAEINERVLACPKCGTAMKTEATLHGATFVFTGWCCPECKYKLEARERASGRDAHGKG
jgi:uncharacterized protein YbaR (Trm112 family)